MNSPKRSTMTRSFRTFRTVCLVVLFFFSPLLADDPPPADPPGYSLEDLYRLAIHRSEVIRNAQEDLFLSERLRDKAMALLAPDLSAFFDYTRYSEAGVLQPEWSRTWGVRLEQSFTLNGREVRAYRMAGDMATKTRLTVADVVEQALYDLTTAYYDIRMAMEREAIALANVRRLEIHVRAVMDRLALEETPRTARYRAEAELARAEAALIHAQHETLLARSRIGIALDLPDGYCLKTAPVPVETPKPGDLACLTETALHHRPDLKALRMQVKIDQEQIEIHRGAYWPNVSLQGVYRENTADPDSFSPDPHVLSGSVTFNLPLFEGGLRKAQVAEAKAFQRKTELEFAMLSKQIRIQVEAAFRDLATQCGVIQSLERQLVSASENYTAVELRFNNGLADSIDVMDANTLLRTSENELAQARYGRIMAHIHLKRAAGVFLPEIMETLEIPDPGRN